MGKYTLKILLDFEAMDDLAARQKASEMIKEAGNSLDGIRDIVLHSVDDRKSIKMEPDGTYHGQWNRGGAGSLPGVSR